MPGGDRMGPCGRGPKTGIGLGYCGDNDQTGYAASQTGQGFGRGFRRGGRGRGWRNRFNASFWPGQGKGRFFAQPTSQDQEVDSLNLQTQELKNTLKEIQTRLTELELEDKERE